MHATALEPIGPGEADTLFDRLSGRSLLLAVSGGPDSVALMGLCARWASRHGVAAPAVATIDHGLRSGSAAEAAKVGVQARALGLPHVVLDWRGEKPATAIQAEARQARYRLLETHAGAIGAEVLVTAHNQEDQAETVLMRLAHGSGLSGLAGMRPLSRRGAITHARPLLDMPKARLIASCKREGWSYLDDPANHDPRFARARWRRLAPLLAAEGCDAARLATVARRLAEADEALDILAARLLARCRRESGAALWRLDARPLAEEPIALAVRVLVSAMNLPHAEGIAGSGDGFTAHPASLARIETATRAFLDAISRGSPLRRSLGGQVLTLDRHGHLAGAPEPPRQRGRVNPDDLATLARDEGKPT